MPAANLAKLSIGGPESTPGTAVARTHRIPVRGQSTLGKKVEKIDDPVRTGKNLSAGSYPVALDPSGGLPLAFRPCGGIAKIIRSVLGSGAAGVQIGACIRVRYVGSQASCKFVADNTGNTLTANIGARGSEAPDAAFGSAGVIDFDNAPYDTIAEVVAAIAAYTDYDCEKLFGPNSLSLTANKVITFTAREGKNTWCYVFFASSASGVYDHVFTYQTGVDEHPTYSIQDDGSKWDNFLYPGIVCDKLSLKCGLKQAVEADADFLGMGETGSQTETELALPDVDPPIFQNGGFTIGAKEYTFIRDLSAQFEGGHLKDGMGQGSLYRLYQQKGDYKASGSASLRLDADSFALRALTETGNIGSCSFFFKGKDIATDLPECIIIELPYISYDGWDPKENNGVVDCAFNFGIRYPNGVLYNNPITIHVIMAESGQM